MSTKFALILLLMLLCGSLTRSAVARSPGKQPAEARARQILERSGVQGGLVVHLGCGDGRLTAALGRDDRYLVQGLDPDPRRVAQAREHIRALGLYGRVSARRLAGKHLPYVTGLVSLLVAEDPGEVPEEEILRVLSPRGVALLGTERKGNEPGSPWRRVVKPWPDDIDTWTHWLHGPDGNPVAHDRVVGPPRRVQWLAEPRWQRHHEATPSLSAMVTSGGRLFAIVNEALAGIDGLPDRWALIARDAFNGKLLWKRPIEPWGWSQWSDHSYGHGRWNHPTHIARRLVAVDDRVYVTLGFNAPLTALDAATGRTVKTYPEAALTDEVLYRDGTLVLVVNTGLQGPGSIDQKPPVRKEVVRLSVETGEMLWRTGGFTGVASKADAIERVTHLSMVLGASRVFCLEEDSVVALDLETGKRLWRLKRDPREKKVTYGHYYFTNLCTLVAHDGVVLFLEPDPSVTKQPWNAPAGARLLGLSAETGEVLWRRDCGMWGHYNPGDVFVLEDRVWVHDASSFSMSALDLRTGEVERTLSTKEALDQGHHHRCYRNKATTRYFLTGRRGVEFIDTVSGESFRHHWTRGTCRYGVMPANGLLYVPPHPCVCYITAKLTGFWALAPARGSSGGGTVPAAADALERGPAFRPGEAPAAGPSPGSDWPTYRHDSARSGCASTVVPSDLRPAWSTAIGGRLSSPVVAGGRVLLASPDRHTVHALSAGDGGPLWSHTAGGRVDTPPTVHRDLVIFGSADGRVTCLRADDGKLVWRRRAAPKDLSVVVRDQLESPWPVHGSVLVYEGIAYWVAGRSSFLDGGILVEAVDPLSGELRLRRRIDSLDPATGDMVEAPLPYDMPPEALGALPDILVGDGGKVFLRHLELATSDLSFRRAACPEAAAKNRRGHPAVGGHLMSVAGLLDDSWFNQTYWTVDGKAHSKLLVFDADLACGVKAYPGSARHSRAIFRPGTEGYTLSASRRPGHETVWSVRVPLRIRAMLLSGETLFAAGTPDRVDAADPWAAFDGRLGGRLQAISRADGKKLAEYPLGSPPTFDGLAAAGGRLFLTTRAGDVLCFEGR